MFVKLKSLLCRLLISQKIREELWLCQEGHPPIAEFYKDFNTIKKIEAKLETITQDEHLAEALSYSKSLYEDEEKRRELVENKATILAGFSGTAIGALITLFILSLDSARFTQAPFILKLPSVLFSILTLIFLGISILCSIKVLNARAYHSPRPTKIFDLAHKSLKVVQKRRIAEYFFSYLQNQVLNDRKLDTFTYGVRFFQYSVLLVLFLALLLAFYGLVAPCDSCSQQIQSPTPTLSLTATETPTETPTLSPITPLTITVTPTTNAITPTQIATVVLSSPFPPIP